MAETLSWNEIPIDDEDITEEDIERAESSGRLPPMKFVGVCVESVPVEANMKNYSCFAANLKWEVEEVLEVNGTTATDEQKEMYEGRFQYDRVMLQHPDEKDGMRNRRILVAKRCGIINNTSDKIPTSAWSDLIIGKRAIVTTEKQSYEDRDGNKKETVKVKFDGYEAIEESVDSASYDDI